MPHKGIPFGTYEASVRLDGEPLQIKLWGADFADTLTASVVHDFSYLQDQSQVAVKP